MNRFVVFVLGIALITSLACQVLTPEPKSLIPPISVCHDIVTAMGEIQPTDIPKNLLESGVKQGNEFDVNRYFSILNHLSMQEGYVLDYVYPVGGIGAGPVLYTRLSTDTPYKSAGEIPESAKRANYQERLVIDDSERGYFESVVMDIMADQFYLYWHANYNDVQIICDKTDVSAIVNAVNNGDFGMKFSLDQQLRARLLTNIEPTVELSGDKAIVKVVVFTKWGGFFQRIYTINRVFPHRLEMRDKNILKYDCGVMF